MDIIARQMARDIAFTLPNSKITSHNPLKINFRCHICGDSATNKHKARGWFYEKKGEMRYGCFNCGKSYTFPVYLKIHHPDRYREYLLEHRKENGDYVKQETDLKQFKKVLKVIEKPLIEKYATRCDLLPLGHPALTYMQKRCIPDDKMKLFWFTMDWKGLTNQIAPDTYKVVEPEPRIVIPIFNADGSIAAMQGRALRSNSNMRYITIKACEESSKIFGMERINDDKTVFYLEGPIDSVFIDNALAIVGGSMTLADAPFSKQRVWVLDNEPRSVETCKKIKNLIEAGEKIVLWDKCHWTSKDVNAMVQDEGASIEDINEYLKSNIVSGIMAKMRFNAWKRVNI